MASKAKKTTALLLASLMCVGAFAGCNGNSIMAVQVVQQVVLQQAVQKAQLLQLLQHLQQVRLLFLQLQKSQRDLRQKLKTARFLLRYGLLAIVRTSSRVWLRNLRQLMLLMA